MKLSFSPLFTCNPQFEPGQVTATAGAMRRVSELEMVEAFARHISGDWGDLGEEDWAENDFGLANSGRLFSRYYTEDGTTFWVITESDRSVTTFLLPDEY